MILGVWHRKIVAAVFVTSLVLVVLPSQVARASLDACTASISPQTVDGGTSNSFSFDINNGGPDNILWVRIVVPPGGYYALESGSSTSWVANISGDEIVFTGGSLQSPFDQGFAVGATVNIGAPRGSWTAQASNDPSGANPITCSGDTTVVVNNPAITVSNIHIANLSVDGITVLWDSNVAGTSRVHYGRDTAYGTDTQVDSTMVTSHSVRLDGLVPDTTYHYQIESMDVASNVVQSGDNTFLTPLNSTGVPTPVVAIAAPPPIRTQIPLKSQPTEKVPPTIAVTTALKGPYKLVPTISGQAADNEALASIDYSTDGGKNWLPADVAVGLGSKKVEFNLSPKIFRDGDYQVLARATDTSGNQAQTSLQKLVLDRLPPIVGSNVVTVGALSTLPDASGTMQFLAGVDHKITLSAVGGPTSVELLATSQDRAKILQVYSLTESTENGLWSGTISIGRPGLYTLVARATDGAGNITTRELSTIRVLPGGRIVNDKGRQVPAEITVYTMDKETNRWIVWDGEAYRQKNPKRVAAQDGYGFYLPSGTYYMQVTAKGYQSQVTQRFSIDAGASIHKTFYLGRGAGLDIGSLHVHAPWSVLVPSPPFGVANLTKGVVSPLVGSQMPSFDLQRTNGSNLKTSDFYGKPAIVSTFNTWSLVSQDQVAVLAGLSSGGLRVTVLAGGESLAKLATYASTSGLQLPIVADSDNQLVGQLHESALPTTYFLDRHGMIKKVVVGLLSKEELLKNVAF